MLSENCYDRHLRAIGQSLEARQINAFELRSEAEQYSIRGVPEKSGNLRIRFRHWRNRLNGEPLDVSLSYGPAEIERLNSEGRLQRAKPDRLPDFYSLANTLRTVGHYLDAKNATLLELRKSPLSVTLLYQDQDGHPKMEERSIASFYNLFVSLHGRRQREAERGLR